MPASQPEHVFMAILRLHIIQPPNQIFQTTMQSSACKFGGLYVLVNLVRNVLTHRRRTGMKR